jgi:hypothetical protein
MRQSNLQNKSKRTIENWLRYLKNVIDLGKSYEFFLNSIVFG